MNPSLGTISMMVIEMVTIETGRVRMDDNRNDVQ
jgi:hypothetical protein